MVLSEALGRPSVILIALGFCLAGTSQLLAYETTQFPATLALCGVCCNSPSLPPYHNPLLFFCNKNHRMDDLVNINLFSDIPWSYKSITNVPEMLISAGVSLRDFQMATFLLSPPHMWRAIECAASFLPPVRTLILLIKFLFLWPNLTLITFLQALHISHFGFGGNIRAEFISYH